MFILTVNIMVILFLKEIYVDGLLTEYFANKPHAYDMITNHFPINLLEKLNII